MQSLIPQPPNRGFTIFEALIYIALFTIVVGGSVLTAYQLFQGSAQVQAMAEGENELNFVLRKLSWLLSGAEVVSPAGSTQTNTLIVNKGADQYTLGLGADGAVTLEGGDFSDALPLTSPRLRVSTLSFTRDTSVDPNTLTVTMTANGETQRPFIFYLR